MEVRLKLCPESTEIREKYTKLKDNDELELYLLKLIKKAEYFHIGDLIEYGSKNKVEMKSVELKSINPVDDLINRIDNLEIQVKNLGKKIGEKEIEEIKETKEDGKKNEKENENIENWDEESLDIIDSLMDI